ncbi:MAG: FG-GAP-like repeat-containing protein, partial [Chitinophagales bacterium]
MKTFISAISVVFALSFLFTSHPSVYPIGEPLKNESNGATITEIIGAIEEKQYEINERPADNILQSVNPASQMEIFYHADGFKIKSQSAQLREWAIEMNIRGIYRNDDLIKPVSARANHSLNKNQIIFHHPDLDIQYINLSAGMRQNFIIHKKIEGVGELKFVMDINSNELIFACDGDKLSANQNGILKYTYSDLKVWDAEHQPLNAQMELKDNVLALVVDDANAVYPITIDPVSATPDATLQSNQANAKLGGSVASAGDVNGDGYDDIIVGASTYTNGQTEEGVTFIYHGSATGINITPAIMLQANQAFAHFGNAVDGAGDVNNDGYDDVVVGAYNLHNGQTDEGRVYIFLGSASGIIGTPAATMESNQAFAYFGSDVSRAGDVNNDGYDDIIIGAYGYDNGTSDEGRAYVFHGSATGIIPVAAVTMESDFFNAEFGRSVNSAGDVNGDGYDDVIVGSPYQDINQYREGLAFIYHGSASGINPVPAKTLQSNKDEASFGFSVSTANDVNGDGFDDVIVGSYSHGTEVNYNGRAYIYHGSASGINGNPVATCINTQTDEHLGYSVSTAGDINNDGYSDILVSSVYFSAGETNEGRVAIYEGSATGINTIPVLTLEGNQAETYFGTSVNTAGDVNNDGFDDIIIGANYFDSGETNEGAAFVYHGKNCVPGLLYADTDNDGFGDPGEFINTCETTLEGYINNPLDCNDDDPLQNPNTVWYLDADADGHYIGTEEGLTQCVSPGDGYMFTGIIDFGDCNDNNSLIYPGAPEINNGVDDNCDGTAEDWLWAPPLILEVNNSSDYFGDAISSAGDINGDGYNDIIIGASGYSNPELIEGAAYIYYGNATGIDDTPSVILESNQANANFGCSVTAAGDVNADGYADVIVGAKDYENGQVNEGAIYIFHGTATGLNPVPVLIIESNQEFAGYGASCASAGDVNDDGYDDIIIGAYRQTNGEDDEGLAFIYHGSASGINPFPATVLESNQSDAFFGLSVASAGDINSDGFSDVVIGASQFDNGQNEEGKVFIYHGSPTGISTIPAATLESNQIDARFGISVSSAGDVNNDGYTDIIIGSYYYNNGQNNEGRAFIYHGSAAGIVLTPAATVESNQSNANFGNSVANLGDINNDNYDDV